jgi:hypothetical protein
MNNLANPPRNAIGDRAGPRYRLTTFRVALRAAEPGAKVDSPKAAVPVLRHLISRLDADQEHFILLALNNQLGITGYKVVSSGRPLQHHRRLPHRLPLSAAARRGIDPRGPQPPQRRLHAQPRGSRPDAAPRGGGKLLDLVEVRDHLILGRDVFRFAQSGELS